MTIRRLLPVCATVAFTAGIASCLGTSEPVVVVGPPPDPITQWFGVKGFPISTTTPGADDVELINLVGMTTGTGRLIAAGEATHGTRQFFELKHRILRSLVERRASIGALAMEASMPDAIDIDQYVRQGSGDPTRALSRLYFWTWRTQEVLDMIRWLHDYNASLPADQRIAFAGVDFQYPGGAVRRVTSWIPASLTSLRSAVVAGYECLLPFVNDDQGVFTHDLAQEPAATRDRCLAGARAALDAITASADQLRAIVGDDSYDVNRQLAVSVVQFATRASGIGGIQYRDAAMADNARWLLRRTRGRMFLWAHNAHVAKASGTMGRSLSDSLGSQYVAIGFMFDSGSFNARPSATDPPAALKVGQAMAGSYEAFFRQYKEMLYFDTHAPNTVTVRQFVINEHPMREIGAVFYTDSPDLFLRPTSLYNDYDVMIFVPESTPTRILAFTP